MDKKSKANYWRNIAKARGGMHVPKYQSGGHVAKEGDMYMKSFLSDPRYKDADKDEYIETMARRRKILEDMSSVETGYEKGPHQSYLTPSEDKIQWTKDVENSPIFQELVKKYGPGMPVDWGLTPETQMEFVENILAGKESYGVDLMNLVQNAQINKARRAATANWREKKGLDKDLRRWPVEKAKKSGKQFGDDLLELLGSRLPKFTKTEVGVGPEGRKIPGVRRVTTHTVGAGTSVKTYGAEGYEEGK